MVIIVFIVALLALMALEAASIAIAGAVFLDRSFSFGWEACWDRPVLLLVFALLGVTWTRSR